ncbi:MAG TPA: amidohydrolase [Candidatus Pygmaiobacter gallistercoris]|nr:amidohydrolase [Candidatus Pygmaiobacter gallistercoris]
MEIRALAHEMMPEIIEFRRDLHRHPEASLQEVRTTNRIAEELDKLGVSYRRLEPTGIVAEVKGAKPGKTVALRGDIDALSITEKTGLPFASECDGLMHACGHDTHAAMLLGAVKLINSIRDSFAGTVRFIFQPAEEIGEGAKLAIKQGALEGVEGIFGMHIAAQEPVGLVSGKAGPSAAATDQFKITIKGKACHGAMPNTGVDAVVAGSALVMNLQTMVSREFSPVDPLVVTVGSFHSGTRWNIVSGEAVLEGTIRSFSREVHNALPETITRIAQETAATFRAEAEVEYHCITEVLISDPEMTDLAFVAANKVCDPAMVKRSERLQMGGEDFAEYTAHAKAAFMTLGAGGEAPQHSDHFVIDESAMEVGIAVYSQMALEMLAK